MQQDDAGPTGGGGGVVIGLEVDAVAGQQLDVPAGDVRVGKVVDIELTDVADEAAALAMGRAMAEMLLANDIVEDFDVHVLP